MGFLVILLVTAVFCCVVPTWCHEPREKIFVLQDPNYEDNRTVVVVTWIDEDGSTCEIFSDDKLTEAIRRISKDQLLHRPTRPQMQELLEECTTFSRRRRRRSMEENEVTPFYDIDEMTTPQPSPLSGPADGWVIFPGTKWCGAGDKAKNDDDLGFHQDTDRCCRAHDKCDDIIEGGGTKYNLTNNSPFTKLNCQCDDEFYDCLKRVNSITSNTIGNTYFNVLRRPCYFYDYPQTKKCKKYKTFLKLKCVEYEKDTSAPKIWQWRQAKRYKKLPFPGPLDITLPF